MENPPPLPAATPPWPVILFWVIVAASAGLACVVVPALQYAQDSSKSIYGHPLIPWFARAFSHIQYRPTMISLFGLTAFLGFMVPKRWLMLATFSIALMFPLHFINVIHDILMDPTSHNLFPFEFAILLFLSIPALPGALMGRLIRHLISR